MSEEMENVGNESIQEELAPEYGLISIFGKTGKTEDERSYNFKVYDDDGIIITQLSYSYNEELAHVNIDFQNPFRRLMCEDDFINTDKIVDQATPPATGGDGSSSNGFSERDELELTGSDIILGNKGESIQGLASKIRSKAMTCDFDSIKNPLDEALKAMLIWSTMSNLSKFLMVGIVPKTPRDQIQQSIKVSRLRKTSKINSETFKPQEKYAKTANFGTMSVRVVKQKVIERAFVERSEILMKPEMTSVRNIVPKIRFEKIHIKIYVEDKLAIFGKPSLLQTDTTYKTERPQIARMKIFEARKLGIFVHNFLFVAREIWVPQRRPDCKTMFIKPMAVPFALVVKTHEALDEGEKNQRYVSKQPSEPPNHPRELPIVELSHTHADHNMFLEYNWLLVAEAYSTYTCIHQTTSTCTKISLPSVKRSLRDVHSKFKKSMWKSNTGLDEAVPSFMVIYRTLFDSTSSLSEMFNG
ncbi:hypothetical protein RF11_03831 [Thelohanellus kitauei]|uniref:Uncharacterized protein n=1 Tax=Thelohanellus kitauei TaxID=669202 RepID=A0A0C2N4U0_THEKT|nr:hypothetical protein RF11_03831 [Thelohanellus kitauei]